MTSSSANYLPGRLREEIDKTRLTYKTTRMLTYVPVRNTLPLSVLEENKTKTIIPLPCHIS
jgi:hypothetical protein